VRACLSTPFNICIYVDICIYVSVLHHFHTCIDVCIISYSYMYICLYMHDIYDTSTLTARCARGVTRAKIQVRVFMYMFAHMYVHVCVYAHVYVFVHVFMNMSLFVHDVYDK